MSSKLRAPRGTAIIVFSVFVLAFAVRLAWLLYVQSPFDSVYSDMGMYVDRADMLLAGKMPSDPRLMAIYPPGTHYIIALEFLTLGRNARTAIAILHALVGAVPATCMTAMTLQFVRRRVAALLVGVLLAFWYPQVAYVGFFSSEIWFAAAIALHAWLASHAWRRAPALFGVGVVSALAFVVRPQFLVTWFLFTAGTALVLAWRRGLPRAIHMVVWSALPLVLMIAVTSVRFHRLSGHWGLIAESAGTRLWADTDVCKIEATWRAPNGDQLTWWFSPPSKPALKPSDTVTFEGFIVDPDILNAIRLERLRGVSWRDRVARKIGNMALLITNNLPWPESNYHDDVSLLGQTQVVTRYELQEYFRDAFIFAVMPLCAAGIALGRHNRAMLIAVANLVTVVFTAAFFFGEARYRIPYDSFALVLAVVGASALVERARGLVGRLRRRRRSRKASYGAAAQPVAEASQA